MIYLIMSSERPDWCQKVQCGYYPGYGPCLLAQEIRHGWLSIKRRKEIFAEMAELAERDPEEIKRRCARLER